MLSIVNKPDDLLQKRLSRLVGNKCPVINCSKDAKTIVARINSKNEKPVYEKSLMLCTSHALACKRGEMSERLFMDTRRLLKEDRVQSDSKSTMALVNREEYLKKVIDEIRQSKDSYITYVGPLPFHPIWYYDLYEGRYHMSSMDREVNKALYNKNQHVALILRNTKRYLEKVNELLNNHFKKTLIDETCDNYMELMKPQYNNQCVFVDTGAFHIPLIFDNSCVFASRSNANLPIIGGMMTYDKSTIDWERNTFKRIIHEVSEGNSGVDQLREFLQNGLL